MKYKLTKKCLRKDLKIPKGYRLIEDWELLKLRKDKKIMNILKNEWLWCNTLNGCRAAGLDYDDDGFHVDGNDCIYYIGCSRGVLVKKEEKKD